MDALLRGALGVIGREVGFADACCYVATHTPLVVSQGHDSIRLESYLMRKARSLRRDLAHLKRAALNREGVVVSDDIFAHTELAAAPRRWMLCFPRVRGQVLGAVLLGRETSFSEKDINWVTRALPAIGLGLRSFSSLKRLGDLSPREREIVEYVCLGYANRDIALACGTSPNTVRNQLSSIFGKLGVASRTELVTRVLRG
jgi:DNA-binding CsgD family transcriptional regulator